MKRLLRERRACPEYRDRRHIIKKPAEMLAFVFLCLTERLLGIDSEICLRDISGYMPKGDIKGRK